jgi:hypothetical protein
MLPSSATTRGPGIQAIGNTQQAFARDHEYQRHGTLSLLAGIDLLTGHVHARVEDATYKIADPA